MTTVIYTGTRAPEAAPFELDIRHWPLLEIHSLEVDRADLFPWVRQAATGIILYSKNAVRAVDAWPWRDAFLAATDRWWAVGAKTAAFAGDRLGVECRAPEKETFEGLLDALRREPLPAQLLSLSVAGRTRDVTRAFAAEESASDGRSESAPDWRDIPVYESLPARWEESRRRRLESDADWIALTSTRGVRTLFDVNQIDPATLTGVRWAAIGPSTAAALGRRIDREVDVVPDQPGRRTLLDAIANSSEPHPPIE